MNDSERQCLRDLDKRISSIHHRYKSLYEQESSQFLPTAAAVDDVRESIARLQGDLGRARLQSAVAQLYCRCFEDSLESLDAMVLEDLSHPYRFVSDLTGVIQHLVERDSRVPSVRVEILLSRAGRAAELVEIVRKQCSALGPGIAPHFTRAYEALALVANRMREVIPSQFTGQSSSSLASLDRALRDITALAHKEINDPILPSCAERPDKPEYGSMLKRLFDVPVESLLDWADDEIARCHENLIELSNGVSPHEDPSSMLARELPACEAPVAMLALMRDYVELARNEALHYISLPGGESCRVTPVPEQIRDSFPWGGYAGGCIYRRPFVGEMFLNETNYRAVTKGWLQVMAIHECYPGHHAQWVKLHASSLPPTIRLGAKHTPLIEGAAHRSEEMLQHIFSERAFPAFVAYRRLHTALRVKADVDLHLHNKTPEQVAKLYQKYLGFDDAVARGQVTYQERNPGYMVCYYYGFKVLRDIEARSSISQNDFTELLFSCGPVSLANFESLVAMQPAERQEYLRGL